jgi:hypothetical protein
MTELQKKMGGWIVEAVSPALIMLLIGSLIFFLAEVVYSGEYLARLRLILGWWVFGSVLVCRIAVTENKERSVMFGLPLALVVLFGMVRFSNVSGVLAPFELIIHIGFIALSWWCASKLVWDCTVVESSRDTTNQGLMERVGWRRFFSRDETDATGPHDNREDVEPEVYGATSDETQKKPNFFQMIVRLGRKENTPGLSVIYFSIAAIPIFGLGQGMIPAEAVSSRQFAFNMFFFYMVGALGLLLTTSLLSLQQYLSKRDVALPNPVAISWIVVGICAIFAVLIAAWILPRPYPEFAIGEPPIRFTAPQDLQSSRFAMWGNDGPDDRPSNQTNQQREKSGDQVANQGKEKSSQGSDQSKSENQTSGGKSPGDKSSDSPKTDSKQQGQSSAADKKSSGSKSSDQKNQKSQGSDKSDQKQHGKSESADQQKQSKSQGDSQKSDSKSESAQDKNDSQSSQKSDAAASKQQDSQNSQESSKSGENQPDQSDSKQDEASQNKDQTKTAESQPETEPAESKAAQSPADDPQGPANADNKKDEQDENTEQKAGSQSQAQNRAKMPNVEFNPSLGALVTVLKWLFYLAIAIVLVYFGWKYRDRIARSWREFLAELKQFWEKLFGARKKNGQQPETHALLRQIDRAKPFQQFADPFAGGQFHKMSNEELVRYCFAAFEAWGNDQQLPRDPDQTPHEFAKSIGKRSRKMAAAGKELADLYCQAIYSEHELPADTAKRLARFWKMLQHYRLDPVQTRLDPLTGEVIPV